MGVFLTDIFIISHLLLLTYNSYSHPLCTDSRAPFIPEIPLTFCQYSGSVCCNATEDLQLQNQFDALNVTEPGCASLLKSMLCSRCDQFSSDIYRIESMPLTRVPVLCDSSIPPNSTQSQVAATGFCSKVWDQCHDISIPNSPFTPQARSGASTNSTSKLDDLWPSTNAFCDEFGGASRDDSPICFNGEPVSLNDSTSPLPPSGICLEKIGTGAYLNLEPHPDGSDRVFLADQLGKIWLATVPEEGSGETLEIDESNLFLDLTDRVHFNGEFGLLGIAFHPNFMQNGRFFASFNCDKDKWPECSGKCSCNSNVGCDPYTLEPDSASAPCRYHSVIAEFTANGTRSQPSLVSNVEPREVRRIFTMGLPFTTHHGGQILFGPTDGYLYFMMGDGGGRGDPHNFSQNKKSLLGKIMRLDVDNMPSDNEINDLNLWGNYSVPKDNPFSEDRELQPEIWALGFRNPWRCSFDSERPSYFLCADVGQEQYEEVNIVTKGGNYGWRVYEGPFPYVPPNSAGNNTSTGLINPTFSVMGYNHSEVNDSEGSASITGGYFYRSTTDPCMHGRYLYTDLFADAVWQGTENPANSGNFTTTQIPVGCAPASPIPCNTTSETGNSSPLAGVIFSFGQDNRKDIYFLSSSSMFRVVRPSRCNFTCSRENVTTAAPPTSSPPSPSLSAGSSLRFPLMKMFYVLFSSILLVFRFCWCL